MTTLQVVLTMDCGNELQKLFKGPVARLHATELDAFSSTSRLVIEKVLNVFGERSAVAQDLHTPITSSSKFHQTKDQIVYLYASDSHVVGFLKIGYKHLFYLTEKGENLEIDPLCVLDFYVHEDYQRQGIGKCLMEFMLQDQQVRPWEVAYDRPSANLLGFNRRHYNLQEFVQQYTNFVIYSDYFNRREH